MDLRARQQTELFKLIRSAENTQFGQQYHFADLDSYKSFQQEVPVSFYSDISDQIEPLKRGAENVFWPGGVSDFAVSAGTSGAGKHLPLTPDRIKADQLFMRKIVRSYIRQQPNIFRLWGKHISLPGTLEQQSNYNIGEISAFTARQVPWWLSPFQLINAQKLIQLPFSQKINRVLEKSVSNDIRVISSTPSWLLTLFQRLLDKTQADSISQIWPNLQLLVCGGVKLANYRPHLNRLLQKDVDFIETYGASEGYFSFTDNLQKEDMKLVINNGIFYEFIPNPLPEKDSLSIQEAIPIWEVETGVPYAMIVSTNAGLWRYALNDIVEFTEANPPRIEVMGRVSEMLDDYGEALYAYEAEQALQEASRDLDLDVGAFTIGSSLGNERSSPQHFWFVQTYAPIHTDTLTRLSQKLDKFLQEKNRHYAIRRESNALGMPEVNSITQQQINRWLEERDKQKAQGKLPAVLKNESDIQFFK